MVRIATWHVNFVRSRIDRLEAWLERAEVDVLAIQETKTSDEHFPYDRLRALGYEVRPRRVQPVERCGHRLAGRPRGRPGWASDEMPTWGRASFLGNSVSPILMLLNGRPTTRRLGPGGGVHEAQADMAQDDDDEPVGRDRRP